MGASSHSKILIPLFTFIMLILSGFLITTTLFFNYGQEIQDKSTSVFFNNSFTKKIAYKSFLSRYKIDSRDVLMVNGSKLNKDSSSDTSGYYTGNVLYRKDPVSISGIPYVLSGDSYPYYYNTSQIIRVAEGGYTIFNKLMDTVKVDYVIRYNDKRGKSLSHSSRNFFFNPVNHPGGMTFSSKPIRPLFSDVYVESPDINSYDPNTSPIERVFGQPIVLRLDPNLINSDINITLGVQFYIGTDVTVSDTNKIPIYTLNEIETTINPESTFTNPKLQTPVSGVSVVKSQGHTKKTTLYDTSTKTLPPNTTVDPNNNFKPTVYSKDTKRTNKVISYPPISLTTNYFSSLFNAYNKVYGIDNENISELPDSVKNVDLSFTTKNSILIVPDLVNFSSAIIDFAVKNNILTSDATSKYKAQIQTYQNIAANIIDRKKDN